MESNTRIDRVVQLELNEISRTVVEALVNRGELPTFKRLLRDWHYSETFSETTYEKIEPWIQWVTAHTGLSFEEHGVFRLGNAPEDLSAPQLWEMLQERGLSSLVFGCMNAKRGSFTDGVFFPDPWAKENETYPAELKPIWTAIASRVQKHATADLKAGDVFELGFRLAKLGLDPILAARIVAQLIHQKADPRMHWRLALLFDEFLADLFLKQASARRYAWNAAFLNCVAHYQHHHWRLFDSSPFDASIATPDARPQDNPMLEGYRAYDRVLARTLDKLDDGRTAFIVISGLSQVPFAAADSKGGKFYYRLRDHGAFAAKAGIEATAVFPMMSRDWQVRFANEERLRRGQQRLEALSVDGLLLFSVRSTGLNTLFIETAFENARTDTPIIGGAELGTVRDSFVAIAVKSGHHTGSGCLWSNVPLMGGDAGRAALSDVASAKLRLIVPEASATA